MISIGVGNVDIGANASANPDEEPDEGTEDSAKTVNDVLHSFRLVETTYDKKSFMTYIKAYLGRVKKHLEEKNPDRVAGFVAGSSAMVKRIVADFPNFQFYMGESMDIEAGMAFLFFKEDGVIPYIWFLADGLKKEKC